MPLRLLIAPPVARLGDICGALSLGALSTNGRCAEHGLRPPFGLTWNQEAIDLEEAILGANARLVSRKKEPGDGETWLVEGLPQIALRSARFQLRKDRLIGIELEYGKDDWTPANYDGFVKSVRQRLEEKHGPGTVVARRQETERGVLQTVLGYRWDLAGGSLELIYFAAQAPTNLFRTVSLHYSAPPPEASSANPPMTGAER